MKSKAIPHMILAVILALVAGVLTIRWLGSVRGTGQRAAHRVETKKVEALVAARAIPKGARLDTGMVRLKAFDAADAPLEALRSPAEAVGRVTAREISQDDPITPDKLLPKGTTGGGLDAAVSPGMRALTIKGSKIMGAGGHITPGSRVDVLVTYTRPDKNEEKVNKVILENILVLTAGSELETKIGKDGREELANTDFFTLMVNPEEAERLALATDLGSLHLALRKPGDEELVPTPGANVASSLDAFAAASGQAPPPAAPVEDEVGDKTGDEDAGYDIETIKADEKGIIVDHTNPKKRGSEAPEEDLYGQP